MVSISRRAVSENYGQRSGGGKCPSCQTRITAFQAGLEGTRKPFECTGCGKQIKKVNSEAFLAIGGITAFWSAKQGIDNFWVLAALFLLICVSIVLKSKYRSQIELIDDVESEAAAHDGN